MDAREFGGALAWKDRAREALATSRRRLLELLRPIPPAVLTAQHSPLMSPAVWDVAHVANYEEQWLLRALGETALTGAETDRMYDAFRNPRPTRGELPLLGLPEAYAYAEQVRSRALRMLDALDEGAVDSAGPLLEGGFVYGMVAQHEQQHVETLVATLQLVTSKALRPLPSVLRLAGRPLLPRAVPIPGGPFEMGSDAAWAYDNERPRHIVEVPPFSIDRYPVTNAEFLAFVEDGGYRRRDLWQDSGWSFRAVRAPRAPALLAARRARMGAATIRGVGAAAAGRARLPRLLVRGRRVRAVGRWTPAHRGGMGEGCGEHARGDRPALPVGGFLALERAREPLAGLRSTRQHWHLPEGCQRVGGRAADWRRLGVDCVRFRSLPGVSPLPLSGIFGRLLRA